MTGRFWEALKRIDRQAELTKLLIQQDSDALQLLEIAQQGGLLGANKPLVRAIGERLNARGGIEEMRRVAMLLRTGYPCGEGGEDGWHPGELEPAWDGVGVWRY